MEAPYVGAAFELYRKKETADFWTRYADSKKNMRNKKAADTQHVHYLWR